MGSLVFLSLIGCKAEFDAPCRAQVTKITYNFSASQQSKIPFGNKDTLVFLGASQDTLYFLTHYYVSSYNYKPSSIKGNPECPPDNDAFQFIRSELRDANAMLLTYSTYLENNLTTYNLGSDFTFNSQLIGDSLYNFKDSVVLPTKTFYKVNTFKNIQGDSILVNASNGLIYFTKGNQSYSQLKFNSK